MVFNYMLRQCVKRPWVPGLILAFLVFMGFTFGAGRTAAVVVPVSVLGSILIFLILEDKWRREAFDVKCPGCGYEMKVYKQEKFKCPVCTYETYDLFGLIREQREREKGSN